ncbi:Archaeal enzyme of ATP-grasp superfamily [Halalkaliarchaeum sp. AArc-CO]|uniref:proteasome assembly chaperone family protein n=1 Tax=unclassified Halalkaliarchaeum TaxID=2678344 RepID=UPI00217DECCE|nr:MULTISPECIES: PAC2 family protein [unclassified Halalkaliarchaeum]MDR5674593.1 PAC2 family protein [Halalkaliarchaeum sp. AArc-GB]UWG52157.1 Archaeal enzyme of ATP-grasp superfamily [Halalkaliarchaeum sp. AArc-CO]
MTRDTTKARYDRTKELAADSPTLIEGLPGLGLVASIAVDQITKQLELEQYGTIRSDEFPPVASFNDGRVRDAVRVYAGEDPDVMTLQSDVPIPPNAVEALSQCVLTELAEDFEKAVFLAGAPAETEAEIGEIVGIATTDELEADLVDAGITLADGAGVIGGITGALLAACYHDDIPASVLVVRSHPYIPDPGAAREVVENALEPLVDFDIDTQELLEQAEEIQRQKHQIAQQLQQLQQQQQEQQSPTPGMFQ